MFSIQGFRAGRLATTLLTLFCAICWEAETLSVAQLHSSKEERKTADT